MANHYFCSECGSKYPNSTWPKTCTDCGFIMWKNPIPVATILQPVRKDNKIGLLLLKRAINPKIGEWALPGGFMEDNGESAEGGALRELFEETGLKINAKPRMVFSQSNLRGQLIIVCESSEIWDYEENAITLCRENSDYKIAFEPENLAFPIHTKAVEDWFLQQERLKRFCWAGTDIKHMIISEPDDKSENLLTRWNQKYEK